MGILERKEREKEARRTQILDAAEKVFKEKGISQATMDDIAREAELAKGTIYLYYRNKYELHVGLILRSFELVNDAFHGRNAGYSAAAGGRRSVLASVIDASVSIWLDVQQ